MKKTRLRHVRSLITREVNTYYDKGYVLLPYTCEIVNTTKVILDSEYSYENGWFVFLNDDYKQIVKDFIDTHYGTEIQEAYKNKMKEGTHDKINFER